MVGTPFYTSPEILENVPYSYKTDVWSLGVVAYEIMNLHLPFEEKGYWTLTLKIKKGEYPEINSLYSENLRELVKKMLSLDQDCRPDLSAILGSCLNRNGLYKGKNEELP